MASERLYDAIDMCEGYYDEDEVLRIKSEFRRLEAELTSLRKERDALAVELQLTKEMLDGAVDSCGGFRAALEKFGTHGILCNMMDRCQCGLDDALSGDTEGRDG